jgi:mRNA interferase RelE/StbE
MYKYQIKFPKKVKSQLKEVKIVYQKEVISALEAIREDPYQGKALERELTDRFSFRVGVYRIIYKINPNDNFITILRIGHRSTVYK